MNYSKYEFTLNLKHTHSDINIPVMLGDTLRRLLITFCDGECKKFKLSDGSRAVLAGKKEDGTVVVLDCVIENNTTVKCDFSATLTNASGVIVCEIRIEAPEGGILTSPDFYITVQPRTLDEGELEIYDGINSALAAINAAEAERVQAEAARESACAEAVASANAAAEALHSLIEGESYIPTIGDNGNWFIDGTDTGKPSVGEAGESGPAYTLTEADKAQIVAGVLASLPTWEGGSY